MALGRSADVAVNHNAIALGVHAANHPTTRHLVEDVWRVGPDRLGPIDFAWYSPDCRHFSNAKGAELRNQKIRGLAWSAVRLAASRSAPRVFALENVREFLTWGPLHRTHSGGCKGERGVSCELAGKGYHFSTRIETRKGETFRAFMRRLQRLGYVCDWRMMTASDFGAATSRSRLVFVGRRDGRLPRWPIGDARSARPASSIIDWSIHLPSIFERAEPYSAPTLARIVEGWRRYGAPAYPIHRGDGECEGQAPRTYSLDEPLRHRRRAGVKQALVIPFIVSTSRRAATARTRARACYGAGHDRRDHRAEVAELLGPEAVAASVVDIGMRYLVARELAAAQSFTRGYVLDRTADGIEVPPTTQVKLVGNSVPPVLAAAIVRAQFSETA
jgi:DNA (cytosine-5)-methyltransferase 1